MIVLAVIRHDYKLLLVKSPVRDENKVWTLPHFEIPDENNPIELIIEKCRIYNVEIEPTDIYLHYILDGKEITCFDTHLLSYTYSKSSNSACWMDANNLEKLSFMNEFSLITDKLINEYRVAFAVNTQIELAIDNLSNGFQLKTEKVKGPSSHSVFVRNDYGNYCLFVFFY